MIDTSPSLLDRLSRRPDDADWRRLVTLYTPVLHAWLRPHGLQASDLDDLTQEALGVVVRELPDFRHNRRPGAFRAWLRTITVHCLRRFWRRSNTGRRRPAAALRSNILSQLEDPASRLERRVGPRTRPPVAAAPAGADRAGVSAQDLEAFRLLVLERLPARRAAAELGLTANAVLIAKSRVLAPVAS